ncbi:MAG: hypothetical protein D6734_08820 [Candidatus Schekmanbacteria bacterium]|nr:MAG: hypothetical protein D6734_08820 [Candidatus Schekmanbacteria bacterium]
MSNLKRNYDISTIFLILLTFFSLFFFTRISHSINLDLVGYVGGKFNDFQVVGNYAYITTENGLQILDISNPASPQIVNVLNDYGRFEKISISGGKMCTSAGKKLYTFDIANPTAPTFLGLFLTKYNIKSLILSGNILYLLVANTGLEILDISTPYSPVLKSTLNISSSSFTDLEVEGNKAYILSNGAYINGFQIVDISNTLSPVLLGSYKYSGRSLYLSGNYAYIIKPYSGMDILDISDSSAPLRAGTYNNSDYLNDVSISGSIAFVASNKTGIITVDVSNHSSPSTFGTFSIQGGTSKIDISGNNGYLIDSQGFAIIDISDPSNITLLGRFNTTARAIKFSISGDTLFSVNKHIGYSMMEIPQIITSQLVTITNYPLTMDNLIISGTIAFACDSKFGNGLSILDISSPQTPSKIGSYSDAKGIGGVIGNYAFINSVKNSSSPYFEILDVSNPASPQISASLNLAAGVFDVSYDKAYLSNGDSLFIIDTNDRSNPSFKGSLSLPSHSVYDIAVANNKAYIATAESGLIIADVNNPLLPTIIGQLDTGGEIHGIFISGNYAYLANGTNGVAVVDITDSTSPQLEVAKDILGNANDILVKNNYVFVADEFSGVAVLKILENNLPQISISKNKLLLNSAGGEESISITVPITSTWNVISDSSWITINSDTSGSGNATIDFSVSPNTSSFDRIGTIIINEEKIQITQQRSECNGDYSFKTDHINIPYSSGVFSTTVVAPDGCFWNAESNSNWVLINHTIDNTIYFSVEENPTAITRTATISVGENEFTIKQGGRPCTFSISESSFSILNSMGGNIAFTISTITGCIPTVSVLTDWISVVTTTNAGDKSFVTLSIDKNENEKRREGSAIIGGKELTIRQEGTRNTMPVITTEDFHFYSAGGVNDIASDGKYVYIVNEGGLSVLDITSSVTSTILASLPLYDVNQIKVLGSYGYVSGGTNQFLIIDLSSPSSPQITSSYFSNKNTYNFDVYDEKAFIVSDGKLKILDISNKNTPFLVGELIDESSFINEVIVSDTIAYCLTSGNKVLAVDISTSKNPKILGSYQYTDNISKMHISGNILSFLTENKGLVMLDVINPTNISLVGKTKIFKAHNFTVSGNYAYLAHWNKGVGIVDLSDPYNPSLLSTYNLPQGTKALFCKNGKLYTGNYNDGSVIILKVSNGQLPVILGSYEGLKEVGKICARNDYLITSSANSNVVTLKMTDFSNNLVIENEIKHPKKPFGFSIYGNLLLIWYKKDVILYDINFPESPNGIIRMKIKFPFDKVLLKDNYLYFLSGNYISIFDISMLTKPKKVKIFKIPGKNDISDIHIVNDKAYILRNKGFIILDISDPLHPKKIGRYSKKKKLNTIFATGDKVYATSIRKKLFLFDTSNAENIKLLNTQKLPFDPWDIYLSGKKFIFSEIGGLYNGITISQLKNAEADLFGKWLSVESRDAGKREKMISGTIEIRNIGGTISKKTSVDVYLSKDYFFDKKDKKIFSKSLAFLDTPDENKVEITIERRLKKKNKANHFIAVIDPKNKISETNKDNNIVISPAIQ